MSFNQKLFLTVPMGVVYIDRIKEVVKTVEVEKFNPAIGMKNPMIGNGGTVYTQVVALPKGRVGIAQIDDDRVRVRVELAAGVYPNTVQLQPGFTSKGMYWSGVFSSDEYTDAILRAIRALAL